MQNPVIIVGTGIAGYQLAREIRKLDKHLPIMLITADDGHYYPKPQLSTALTNKKTIETLIIKTKAEMAAELQATIITRSPLEAIHPSKNTVFTEGTSYSYSKLILCIGGHAVVPRIAGMHAAILSVNHLDHYTLFQSAIKNKKSIAIFGTGLLGCEFANDLANVGFDLHMIGPGNAPLDLLLPEKVGHYLQIALEDKGVQFYFRTIPQKINKVGEKYEITLSNGKILQVDLILSAIGLKPQIELASLHGIHTNHGIIVNRYFETNLKDIYAFGDCAEMEGEVMPFIAPIQHGARALAKTLLNERTPISYPAMPIVVKTPAHPIIICPPPKNTIGEWKLELMSHGVRGLFYNKEQALQGFILTHDLTKERMDRLKELS